MFLFPTLNKGEHSIYELCDSENHKVHICSQTGRWICSENLSEEETRYLQDGFPPMTLEQYKPSPSQLIINVTNRCNLNCVYCYASEKEKKIFLKKHLTTL